MTISHNDAGTVNRLRVVTIQCHVRQTRTPATFLLTAHSLILTRFPCVTNRASSAFWNADGCRRAPWQLC